MHILQVGSNMIVCRDVEASDGVSIRTLVEPCIRVKRFPQADVGVKHERKRCSVALWLKCLYAFSNSVQPANCKPQYLGYNNINRTPRTSPRQRVMCPRGDILYPGGICCGAEACDDIRRTVEIASRAALRDRRSSVL